MPTLAGVVVVTFGIMLLLPGDPALVLLGQDAGADQVAELRRQLSLDDPWFTRLGRYFNDLLHGDLGTSIFQAQPVTEAIGARLGATLEVATVALVVALVLGLGLGTLAALRKGTVVDTLAMLFAQIGVSMPVFWLGILLMLLFAVRLDWLPAIGRGAPLLPALMQALGGRPARIERFGSRKDRVHKSLPRCPGHCGQRQIIRVDVQRPVASCPKRYK